MGGLCMSARDGAAELLCSGHTRFPPPKLLELVPCAQPCSVHGYPSKVRMQPSFSYGYTLLPPALAAPQGSACIIVFNSDAG